MNVAPPELLLIFAILLIPVAIVVGIWALVDVLSHTKDDFMLIGSDRTVWLVAIIGLTLACGVFGLIPSLYYLLKVRPQFAVA